MDLDAAAFTQAVRLLCERAAALPGLLGAAGAPRLVPDPLSADAPPLLQLGAPQAVPLSGRVWLAWSATYLSPELWLEGGGSADAEAALLAAAAAAGGGAWLPTVTRSRHPATGVPSLVLHACGTRAALREAAAASPAGLSCAPGAAAAALRAYGQLLSWSSLALPMAGFQLGIGAFAEELARVALSGGGAT